MKVNHFTLIEMIMVMGVMILLASVAIPAYSSLFSGRKTTLAANVLNAAIMTARARAVSSKNYTAIIFIKNSKSDNGYTSFRVAEVYHDSDMENNNFIWRRWAPDSSITFFPDNTMIPSTKNDFGMTNGTEGNISIADPPRVTNLANSGLGGSYAPAIIIKPNGQLAGTGDKNMVVRFVEMNRYKSNTSSPKIPLNINWLTCKTKFLDPVE